MNFGSLAERIAHQAPFAELICLNIIEKIGQAMKLAFADHQLIHQDLVPSNILFQDTSNNPCISDFGLALWISEYFLNGYSCISSSYISPDQISGEITWQSDLYSLGIIFFQMLTGKLPFAANNEEELLNMHMVTPLPSPENRNQNIRVSPSSLKLLARMTAKDPGQRFSSWEEFCGQVGQAKETRKRESQQVAPFVPEKPSPDTHTGKIPPQPTVKKKKLRFRKK